MTKHPNATDVHVGRRMRMRRLMLQMSQEAFATKITLGCHAFDSVVEAYRLNQQFPGAVEDQSPIRLDQHRVLFAVYHPAARPTDRNQSQMRDDWIRIARYLHPIVDRTATF